MVYLKINKLVHDLIKASGMHINKIACHALCKSQIISYSEMSNVVK